MNTFAPIFTPVQEDIRAVEALILTQADDYNSDLRAALSLILSSGGKRIRPTVTLLVGYMLGAPKDRLITLASAIELLHTATLVHDDLIDGSLLRRGMPTLNSQWTPGATVLTGDFLFACAAKLAADTNSVKVMQLFAKTLTVIVNGEITQSFSSHCEVNREEYYKRIYAKTASLFELAATGAALISDVNDVAVDNLRKFGHHIGMAFQITDDILDFTGEQREMGKPVGNDLRQGLITLPTLYYVESHPEDMQAQSILDGNCPAGQDQAQHLIDAIRNSDAPMLAKKEADQFVEHAIEALQHQPVGSERQALQDLAHYIVKRQI